jgi:uncharacterized protein YkwD
MKLILIETVLKAMLVSRSTLAKFIEYGKDRFGSDINGADVELTLEGSSLDSRNTCNANSTYRAWTFIRFSYYNKQNASCKLKYSILPATDDFRTVSGIKDSDAPYRLPSPGPITGPTLARRGPSSDLAQEYLAIHNKYRAEVGVPPLSPYW